MSSVKIFPASVSVPRAALWERIAPWLLISIALMSRLPFQSRFLYHWDSVNFAFALDRFDVAQGQPHAPGYLLYVLIGHVALWITGDPQTGYVLLAMLGSALSVAALYELGRRMWDVRVGWISALLLLSSPLFWFYGEVALPHALDALAVIVAALLSWRVWQDERRTALGLALWLGLAGGFRPQTLVFLFPLAVVACSRLPFRWMVGSTAILGVTGLAWLIPLLVLSGGVANYFTILSGYSEHFNRSTSVFLGAGWSGISYNLNKLVRYTLWGWALGIFPAVLGLWLLRRPLHAVLRSWRVWFLVLWAAPCLLFYTLIHMGQQGLIFVYLPILMLISARASVALSERWRWGILFITACVAGNALLFIFAPSYLLPNRFKVLSQATINEHDMFIQGQIEAVRNDLPPDAVLLSDQWRFPQYYLPDVTLVPYNHGEDSEENIPQLGDMTIVDNTLALAWYEPALDEANLSQDRTQVLRDYNGVQLRVLRRNADEQFYVTPEGFGIE